MNSQQWRRIGYKTVFKGGQIYLYRPQSGVLLHTPVKNGEWMLHDNVNRPPWIREDKGIDGIPEPLQSQIRSIAEECYCDTSGGINTCDFCSGVRLTQMEIPRIQETQPRRRPAQEDPVHQTRRSQR